jgi:hypothetical protein
MKSSILDQIKSLAGEIANSDIQDVKFYKSKLDILRDKLAIYEFLNDKIDDLESDKFETVDTSVEVETDDEVEDEIVEDQIEDDKLSFEDFEQETEAEINELIEIEEKIENAVDAVNDNKVRPSLNDKLKKGSFNIGLNDRILFEKKLFDGSKQDFNRVISQIGTFESFAEIEDFMNQFVKPDYGWDDNDEVYERFMILLQSKFE